MQLLSPTHRRELQEPEEISLDIEVAAGFSTKSQIPIKIELLSYDGSVYEKEILIVQEPTLATAVVPDTTAKTLDLYAMIVDKSELIAEGGDGGDSITGGAVTDLIFDGFVSNEDYYLEVNILSLMEVGGLNNIPFIKLFIPDTKVVFAELYGPYPIDSQEGFVFAQQFSYDPEVYDPGDYVVEMKIMQGLHELSSKRFEVYLE